MRVHGYSQHSDLVSQAHSLYGDGQDPSLADKVFQMVYSGYDGSTFPFAYWPVKNWNSTDIMSTITDAMVKLSEHSFKVRFG